MSANSPCNTCQYVVPKKNRRCKMLTKKGGIYCGEHLFLLPESQRISCPKDPKHSVDRAKLEEHLQRCNARLPADSWIREDLNLPLSGASEEYLRPTEQQLIDTIAIIRRIYPRLESQIRQLPANYFYDQHMRGQVKEVTSKKRHKHWVQLGSIIDHLQFYDLLHDNPNSCLIDLGSGKAQLVYWLAKKAPNCRYLLVDKQGARKKFDNKALQENANLQITRIRCLIEHLDLGQVPIVQQCLQSITVVCKHFCGNAMDKGIRCIENAIKQGIKFNGFVFASCCHHRCTIEEFVGLNYLRLIGIESAEAFAAIRHISTWATCAFQHTSSTEQTITNAEKLELGRQAKIILETARAKHLQTLGYQVDLFKYVDAATSPENLLVVGYLKNGN